MDITKHFKLARGKFTNIENDYNRKIFLVVPCHDLLM